MRRLFFKFSMHLSVRKSQEKLQNFFFFFRIAVLGKLVMQTQYFLTRLPTRQDGVENRDKVKVYATHDETRQ